MNNRPIWLIVDGNNQVHSTAHGTRGDVEATPRYVLNRIEKVTSYLRAVKVVTAWDSGPTFRNDLLPTYKAKRSKLEGIDQAIKTTQRMIEDAGHLVFVSEGFEADDIIATVAKDAYELGCNAVIYSADKDLHQLLVPDFVSQLLHASFDYRGSDELKWLTAKDLFKETGVTPSQWVDYRCMIGDDSDNVKGVPLVGPAAAAAILGACQSLEKFYEEPFRAPIKDKQHSQMMAAKERVSILKEIFTLRRDVPVQTLAGAMS